MTRVIANSPSDIAGIGQAGGIKVLETYTTMRSMSCSFTTLMEEEEEEESAASMSSSSAFTPGSNSWQSACGPTAPRTCPAKKLPPPLTDIALSSFLESRNGLRADF